MDEPFEFARGLAIAIVALLALAIVVFRFVWRGGAGLHTAAVGTTVSLLTLGLAFLAAECWFAGVYDQSDGYGQTLAGKLWFQRHWKPINSLGYRDTEHDFDGKDVLFVVGDSFAAGHGTRDIDDRLAGVLQRQLGGRWEVAVLAENGWNPVDELAALRSHPEVPDRIVLSYYINDIESSAIATGNPPPKVLLRQPAQPVRWLVERSHFANWVYWRVVRGEFGTVYWDWLKAAYGDEATLHEHGAELRAFADFATEHDARLICIVWPNLDYVQDSLPFTGRVTEMLAEAGIEAIDLGAHFRGRDESSLVVNAMDGHPNPRTQAEVARLLLERW